MDVKFAGEVDTGEDTTLTIATDGVFLAFAVRDARGAIEIAYLCDLNAPALRLQCKAQVRSITAMCIGSGRLATSDPVPGEEHRLSALLCSASSDAVVVWNLAAAYAAAAEGKPPPVPIQVMFDQGVVDAVTMGADHMLAVCMGLDVNLFDLSTMQHKFRLEGHAAPVLSAIFFDHTTNLLVTAGEDRGFKVWDLQLGQLAYQSAVLGASAITALAVDPSFPRLAVAASDGVVRFFDLSNLPACRALQAVDVSKQLTRIADQEAIALAARQASSGEAGPRVISSQPAWKNNPAGQAVADLAADANEGGDASVTSACVLSLYYSPLRTYMPHGATGLLAESPKLLVGTMRGLAVLDTHTYEVLEGHFFGISSTSGRASPEPPPELPAVGAAGALQLPQRRRHWALPQAPVAGAFAFGLSSDSRRIFCCAAGAYEPGMAVLRLAPAPHGGAAAVLLQEEEEGQSSGLSAAALRRGDVLTLSVFQTNPLPDSSPLKAVSGIAPGASPRTSGASSSAESARGGLQRVGSLASSGRSTVSSVSSTASRASAGSNPPRPGGKAAVTNQPVTFHAKIKSSGYGFVQQKHALGSAPPPLVKVSKSKASSSTGKNLSMGKQYPVACGPLVVLQPRNILPGGAAAHRGAIMRIAYSSDASRLLTASADKTARVLKLPLSKHAGEGTDLIGHNAAVTTASWSHDGTLVLTASADRSARLWNAGCAQPLLEFTHTLRHLSCGPAVAAAAAGTPKPLPNPAFLNEVRAARFFYLDQFALLAVGSKLHMYKFKLSEDKGDDIERMRNNNKYKLVETYSGAAQVINDFSCINSFQSPLALLAGSHRGVEVVDLSTMQCVSSITDVHARPPHTIVQAATSLYVSHPKEAYELFATAATDGTAKLWDVRCARCVRTFSGHKNSQIIVGVAFSPCLRFFAAGSEDKVAYLYDLRMGTILHRVRGAHGEAVTDVAFNPLHPQLATATLDGGVHFYSDVV